MIEETAEERRLASLGDYQIMDTPAETHFDAIVEEAAFLTGAPISMISLVDDKRQWFKAKTGVDSDGDPVEQSICAVAIRQGDTFVVNDASVDDRFQAFAAVRGGIGIRFYAGTPLTMRDGARLGTLCVIDVEARSGLSEEEQEALEALARRAVSAIELRRDMRERGEAAGHTDDAAPWLSQAGTLLGKAAAALAQAQAAAPLAQLESVIAMVDDLRRGPVEAAA